MPKSSRDEEEDRADPDREGSDEPRDAIELALERASLAPRLLRQLRDPAKACAMPVASQSPRRCLP